MMATAPDTHGPGSMPAAVAHGMHVARRPADVRDRHGEPGRRQRQRLVGGRRNDWLGRTQAGTIEAWSGP